MDIGTPLSASSTRALLLGSGELGKELTIAFQRLGVEVVAVDRYENAPAHQVAHRAHVIDMSDAKALRQLIESEKPQFVVPEIEAIATATLADLEREGNFSVVPTARAVQLTMNREGIRLLASDELGLSTSRFAFADSYEELHDAVAAEIGYPCFVKPVQSSSGKGQSLVTSNSALAEAWRVARTNARVDQARVIVEAKVEFDFEITLLTVRALGGDGNMTTQFCAPIGHRQVDGDFVESWQPQPLTDTALERARHIATRVTSALGGLGVFGVELFVRGDAVMFNEVSPRPHDTGMVTMVTQWQNEFDLHARAILGLPVSTALRNPGASAVIYGGFDREVIAYRGLEDALAVPGTEVRLFGKPFSLLKRRMGLALAYGDDLATARGRATLCASLVRPVKFQRGM